MPNWTYTSYAIEGPKETLQKIEQAILHHDTEDNSAEDWEGNVLKELGLTWESNTPDGKGKYMRGFIEGEPWWDNGALRVCAMEAWGVTDFNEVLEENFPDIKVFYTVEEEGMGIYKTNDREGLYFEDKVYVDTCINGDYRSDYFKNTDDAYQWLSEITDGKIKTKKDVEDFNDGISERNPDEFIYVHEYLIIDN